MVPDKNCDNILEYYDDGVKIQNFVFKDHSCIDELIRLLLIISALMIMLECTCYA